MNTIYNIQKALNRITWRFKNPQIKINESKITINEEDINAIDFLITWVEQQKKETINHNQLFAKLYCYALSNEIEFYKDVRFANKKLQEKLNEPIENHYDKIVSDLNRLELTKYMQSKGIITDHIESLLLTESQQQEQDELKAKILKENSKEVQSYVLGIFKPENVYKSINNQITECINRFKNKP